MQSLEAQIKTSLPHFDIQFAQNKHNTNISIKASTIDFMPKTRWFTALIDIMRELRSTKKKHPPEQNINSPELFLKKFEICLIEAINNAILHGNLNLEKSNSDTTDALLLYLENSAIALQNDSASSLYITVNMSADKKCICLSVTDNGQGYDAHRMLQRIGIKAMNHNDDNDSSGDGGHEYKNGRNQKTPPPSCLHRGLLLIYHSCDEVSFSDEGRSIHMKWWVQP